MLLSRFSSFEESHGRHELILLAAAIIFVIISGLALSLAQTGAVQSRHLVAPILWAGIMVGAHLLLNRYQPYRDPYLLPIIALLTGWGLILIDRLAPNFLDRQLVWLFLSTAVMLSVAIFPKDLRWLRRYRYTWLFLGLLLLGATLIFGVNPSGFGATLWLPLPLGRLVFFQPSELLKLLLVIFLASYFDERESLLRLDEPHGRFGPLPYLAPLLLMWGFCMLLLIWQRDLGAATLFFVLFLSLLYLASGDWRYLVGGLVLLLLSSLFAYFAFDVVALRVDAWINPWPDADNRAFQIVQSLYAVASGSILGQGIGQGFPTYIPVVHSDFVFAAIAEEWGLIGALTVVACYLVLAQRGLRIALLSRRPFRRYLAAGITILIAAQALLIMGGVTRLLPLTGVTLPFLSYGGSSLLISGIMAGFLLYLSATTENMRPQFTRTAISFQKRLGHLLTAVIISYLLVVGTLVYWGFVQAGAILAREDNPRLVEAALRIQRGQILDRDGAILAETVGPADDLIRHYPITNIGPAVGYYSFRHGTAGIEEGFDTLLRGDSDDIVAEAVRQALHEPQVGRNVQLSLDAALQQAADATIEQNKGAVVLLELPSNQILAMASHPNYDPNLLDDQFEILTEAEDAPLLNRAVQGQYQPGRLLQPFILAGALEQGVISLAGVVDHPNRPVQVDGQTIQCATAVSEPATWADVLKNRCPGPLQDLGDRLGLSGLDAIFNQFQFNNPPDLPINTEIVALEALADPLLAGIGQENLLISPLQLALAWSTLGNEARMVPPALVTAVQNEAGDWETVGPAAADQTPILSDPTLRALRRELTQDDRVEFSTLVLSGPDGSTNAWYVGLAPAINPQFVVALVVEESADLAAVEAMGRQMLETAVAEQTR